MIGGRGHSPAAPAAASRTPMSCGGGLGTGSAPGFGEIGHWEM